MHPHADHLGVAARRCLLGVVTVALAAAALPSSAAGAPSAAVCGRTPTRQIGEVQGAGAATPYGGQQVTVRGLVVGDVPGLSGFYLQDADGDGNAATSDGIFVFSSVELGLGDTVVATGLAQEFGGQTQISAR
ncbi:MAG: endonuclease, partial [Actinomycetes bacterium]